VRRRKGEERKEPQEEGTAKKGLPTLKGHLRSMTLDPRRRCSDGERGGGTGGEPRGKDTRDDFTKCESTIWGKVPEQGKGEEMMEVGKSGRMKHETDLQGTLGDRAPKQNPKNEVTARRKEEQSDTEPNRPTFARGKCSLSHLKKKKQRDGKGRLKKAGERKSRGRTPSSPGNC